MLQVENTIEMDRMDALKEECIEEEMMKNHKPKQMQKKKLFTPTKMLIVVVGIFVLALASYEIYSLASPAKNDSKLNQSHGKFIQTAGSNSGGETSSTGGSTSSKTPRDSNRPIGIASAAGKDRIGSSFTGDDGDDQDPSERDNDGDRRNKLKQKNKYDGSSTEGDSDESEGQSGNDATGQLSGDQHGQFMPNVGSIKKAAL